MTNQTYRPDIDGLRAVAVWLVIIFHLDLLPLTGGYIGVDVFFVISGYVISRLIVVSMAAPNGFSFAHFYARRILRLLPALLAVTTFVLAIGWFWLGTVDYQQLARSALATNFFVSNWFFARQSGYFMAEPLNYPLLHTWSLAVEEQFYVFAPLAIVALVRKKFWPVVLCLACVISLGLAISGAWRAAPTAYYYTSNRIFELGLGVALGTHAFTVDRLRHHAHWIGYAGLALILSSAAVLGKTQWFPGPFALPVAIGTALIILAGDGRIASRPSALTAFLSSRLMVFNGKISYSLYLWHWALLTCALLWLGRPLEQWDKLLLVGLIYAFAVVSFFLIEQPARRAATSHAVAGVVLTATAVLALAGAATFIDRGRGLAWRLPTDVVRLEAQALDKGDVFQRCLAGEVFRCAFGASGDAPTRLLLWGDSHALALAGVMSEIVSATNERGALIGQGGCPPLIDSQWQSPTGRPHCTRAASDVRAFLQANPSVRHVVLGARWALYAGSADDLARRRTADADTYTTLDRETLAVALERTVTMLRAAGMLVTLVGPVPEFRDNVPLRTVRAAINRQPYDFVLPVRDFEKRQDFVLKLLATFANREGVTVIYPHTMLCNVAGECRATSNGNLLYWDNDHLNMDGARLIKSQLGDAVSGRGSVR